MRFRHSRIFTALATTALLVFTPALVGAASPVGFTGVFMQSTPNPNSYDISWIDQGTGLYYLADTSHGQVNEYDVSGGPQAAHFVQALGKGQFTGAPTGAACPVFRGCNGPNGVVTDSNGKVWAGNGDGTIKELDPTTGQVMVSIATGGKLRSDELAYDSKDQTIIIGNDDEAFLTMIDVGKQAVVGHYYYSDVGIPTIPPGGKQSLYSTPGNGIEQPVWNPATGLFYQAMPANTPDTGNGTIGRVDVFKGTPDGQGNMQRVTSFYATGCGNGPTGLTLTANQTLVGACDNGGIVMDVVTGNVLGMIPKVGGADEVWFNAADGNVYFAQAGSGMLGIGNPVTFQSVGSFRTGPGSHSVTAYAANDTVYSPVNGKGIMIFAAGANAPIPAPAARPPAS